MKPIEFNNNLKLPKNALARSNMKDFNANAARELAKLDHSGEIDDILLLIKEQAMKGKDVLHVYQSLYTHTREELKKRGFRVTDFNSVAAARDGLYYSIYWNEE